MEKECSICWLNLSEKPTTDSSEEAPPVKKTRTSTPTNEICCTPCGHLFHKPCLTSWFQKLNGNRVKGGTCPTCRKLVAEEKLYPVYLGEGEKSETKAQEQNKNYITTGPFDSWQKAYSDLETRYKLLEEYMIETVTKLNKETERANEERDRANLNEAIVNSLSTSTATNNTTSETVTYSSDEVDSEDYDDSDENDD